ncbi:MAG: hypothetical protein UU70_C0032G0009 [Candidatus Yanofskybacteria bacterium GW2011_GWA1_41_6]|uniref:Uncharacterized protein n=1 Tax=Candidatus Yanofskybacteria bacterium GW2011_GWA1_41_6 TaxID=1619020 RepID=A0A0G0WIV4_9BACT|nr:MAG: hypothetical protein UU70_C0032G0009 [Candidatus Yanofskybacteria bacterium GW2011_GWA1_41_6]
MCDHACSFHKKKGSHVTPCCVPCSCGQNVELSKMDLHLSNCHRVGLDIPRTPFYRLAPPSVRESEPTHAETAA